MCVFGVGEGRVGEGMALRKGRLTHCMTTGARPVPHRPTFEEALLTLEALCAEEKRAGCAMVGGGGGWVHDGGERREER